MKLSESIETFFETLNKVRMKYKVNLVFSVVIDLFEIYQFFKF